MGVSSVRMQVQWAGWLPLRSKMACDRLHRIGLIDDGGGWLALLALAIAQRRKAQLLDSILLCVDTRLRASVQRLGRQEWDMRLVYAIVSLNCGLSKVTRSRGGDNRSRRSLEETRSPARPHDLGPLPSAVDKAGAVCTYKKLSKPRSYFGVFYILCFFEVKICT